MRYYGNKTKLLPFIEQVVRTTNINGTSKFVDFFSGTASVGKHFKKLGYSIISNDIMEFAYCFSKTYIVINKIPSFNSLKTFIEVNSIQEILNYLNSLDNIKNGFILNNYSPVSNRQYFSEKNAIKIDSIRTQIEDWFKFNLIKEEEYYYLITSLLNAINLISNVSGTYAAFLKNWDKRALKPLELRPVELIFNNNLNYAFKIDANKLVNKIEGEIFYLDPPYNSRQYASNYFILELVAEGWFNTNLRIYGKTGMRDYSEQKSLYNSKSTAEDALNDLITNANCQKLLLSYNNEGIISDKRIISLLSKFGNVEIFEFPHKRYKSINQKIEDPSKTIERIYLLNMEKHYKPKANRLNGKEWLSNSFSIWRDLSKNDEERKLHHPAIFTVKLVSKLIDIFTNEDNSVILDCFAGAGSTLIAGLLKNMDVIGLDINPKYKDMFLERLPKYHLSLTTNKYQYIIGNSNNISNNIDINSVDLCITSPPYWDILNRKRTADNKKNINYSNSREDIGNISDYNLFLNELGIIINEVYKVLKKNHYFILNVMDLRKKSIFYPLHIDAINLAKSCGFNLEDIIIWDRQHEYNNMRPLGYPYKFIINKVHEYLLILRKY